jgi:nicotinamidase-related amidase
MKTSLISQAANSQLVIIDMQEKLASVMAAAAMQQVLKNCGILLQTAKLLEIPTIFTEQYPKGLGKTCSQLSRDNIQAVEKTAFSCCDEPTFNRKLTSDRPQIVLAGMEAHICILQTAIALHAQGPQVFVVQDAVISRDPANKTNALQRLQAAGVIVSNTESIVFEWLGKAEGDVFKQISQLIR